MFCTINYFYLNNCILGNVPSLHKTAPCFAMGICAPAHVWLYHCIRNFHALREILGHKMKVDITTVWVGGEHCPWPQTSSLTIIWCFLSTLCSRIQEEENSSRPTRSIVTSRTTYQTHWHFGSIFMACPTMKTIRLQHQAEGHIKQKALQIAQLHDHWPGHVFFCFTHSHLFP